MYNVTEMMMPKLSRMVVTGTMSLFPSLYAAPSTASTVSDFVLWETAPCCARLPLMQDVSPLASQTSARRLLFAAALSFSVATPGICSAAYASRVGDLRRNGTNRWAGHDCGPDP